MGIEWSDSFSTGIEWQDLQHRELFRRIDKLMDAMDSGIGREEVLRLFNFLDLYFVIHLDTEEKAMDEYGYPDILRHIEEHTRFIEDVSRLEGEAKKGVTADLIIKTKRIVLDWFINHIGEMDKAFGAFMRAKKRQFLKLQG